MTKRTCECCLGLAENDSPDDNGDSFNLISLCFSIQILSHSADNSLVFICDICAEKLKDCNEFRCQILDSQNKLRKLQSLVAPKVESVNAIFKCESIIKEELYSDCGDDSMDIDDLIVQRQSCNGNKNNAEIGMKKLNVEMKQNAELNTKAKRKILSNKIKIGKKTLVTKENPVEMNPEKQKIYQNCLEYALNKSILDCGICNERFSSHNLLVNHVAIHCPNFSCETCGKSFLLKEYLDRHMMTHDEKKMVTCTLCGKSVHSYYLHKHTKTHSKSNVKKGKSVSTLRREKIYSEILPFKIDKETLNCKVCNEHFPSYKALITHLAVHYPNFTCETCGKSFLLKEYLQRHIKIHFDSKVIEKTGKSRTVLRREKKYAEFIPFELNKTESDCKVCGDSFASHKSLISHLAIHYPNFICDTCGKPFLLDEHLVSHMKSHEEDNVSCAVCKKVLKLRSLPEHMTIHSGKKKRSVCPHCGERFELHHQRNKHMEKLHNVDIYRHHCNFCSKKFYLASHKKSHIRRCHFKEVNITCDVCGKGFFSTAQLKNHMLKHTGEKNFTCDVCSKSYTKKYSLVIHMKTHIGNAKKFKCSLCDKEFTQNGSLKVHMNNMHEKKESITF